MALVAEPGLSACGTRQAESMPADACIYFYERMGCGVRLRPKPGDFCVFCSYGSAVVPPVQLARAWGQPHQGCCG